MPAKAATFSVRLPDDVKHQVDEIARATKRSRSFIINEAVALYVRDRAEYARELDEAIKSAINGVGHSAEQVFAWMDAWASGDKRALPAPDVLPLK
jgi:RHH-type transcriptional regulator, rel operon repressor / antitoxin RelB